MGSVMEWSGNLFLLALGSSLPALMAAHLACVAAAPLAISSLDIRDRRSTARKRGGGTEDFLLVLNPSPGPPTSATDSGHWPEMTASNAAVTKRHVDGIMWST